MPVKKIVRQEPYRITDGITQSMLSTWLTCRQKSKFELSRWAPLEQRVNSANRGDLFHTLLEHWYGWEATEVAYKPEVEAFVEQEIEEWLVKLRKNGPVDETYLIDALNMAKAVFPVYTQRWDKSDRMLDWESLEEVFDIKWNLWRLRGKFDGVCMMKTKTKTQRWLFETKTKAQIDEEGIMDALTFDFQNLFYLSVLDTMNRPCVGVIYNVIRTPSLRKGKTETDDEFAERTVADVDSRRAHYFHRFEVSYPQKVIKQFQSELNSKLIEFQQWTEDKLPTYRNESACITKFKCPFLKACSTGGSMLGYSQSRILFRELQSV